VVVLAEDARHQQFVRKYLYRVGYARSAIEFEPPPSGRGSGEQWVRERYVRTLLANRARTKRVKTGLTVVIDADTGAVRSRLQQFQASLREGKIPALKGDEPVVHLVPRRNIETWILCLTGSQVDEETHYHRQPGLDEQIATAAIAFFDGSRPNTNPPGYWIPSLLAAIPQVQRLQ
jgi:hypothetical protein